jgi:hypothetical protein
MRTVVVVVVVVIAVDFWLYRDPRRGVESP